MGLFAATALFLVACSEKTMNIEISNSSSSDRIDEIVSVYWADATIKLQLADKDSIIVLDEAGAQLPYQIITNGQSSPQEIIFPATVTAGNTNIYTIKKGSPLSFEKKTFGRSIPERKDDFAWENDRIAFRMYGPALAPENPSNGVDIWLKRTNDLIVDKFYNDELQNGLSYHIDHGQGLDCYKVGHTLGAGGISPFVNDSLWIGGYYSTAKVLDSGILRTTFTLTYDSLTVDGKNLTQIITISLDANSQLNKAVVSYDGDFESMTVAPGIWLHPEIGNIKINKEAGYIAYGENAVSDAGLESGRNYIGVLIPNGMKNASQHNIHLLGFADYKKGEQFTYYFGAGWSKWGFQSDDDWFKYMDSFSAKLKEPLKVTIK